MKAVNAARAIAPHRSPGPCHPNHPLRAARYPVALAILLCAAGQFLLATFHPEVWWSSHLSGNPYPAGPAIPFLLVCFVVSNAAWLAWGIRLDARQPGGTDECDELRFAVAGRVGLAALVWNLWMVYVADRIHAGEALLVALMIGGPTLLVSGVLVWRTARALARVSRRAVDWVLIGYVLALAGVELWLTAGRFAEERLVAGNSLPMALAVVLRVIVWNWIEEAIPEAA